MPGLLYVCCGKCGVELHRSSVQEQLPVHELKEQARDAGASPWCPICARFVRASGLSFLWRHVEQTITELEEGEAPDA